MAKTIVQKVSFRNSAPKDSLYLNTKKHTKATEATAEISNKEGIGFTAHNIYIRG